MGAMKPKEKSPPGKRSERDKPEPKEEEKEEEEENSLENTLKLILNKQGKHNNVALALSSRQQARMSTSKWLAFLLSFLIFATVLIYLSNRPRKQLQDKTRRSIRPPVLGQSGGGVEKKKEYNFPKHWGEPGQRLRMGSREVGVKLPAGYGMGGVELKEWIQSKIEEDSRILQEIHQRSAENK